jgi:drug/metabolite transporter (DMT)-like permease
VRHAETGALVGMAALWGGSFVFQRALVPVYGPVPLTFLRLLFAGLFLAAVSAARRKTVVRWPKLGVLMVFALLSTAVPYTLFAFGAKTLSTAVLSVLNATAPMFGAAFAAVWLRERLRPWQAAGLLVGSAGVAVAGSVWDKGLPAGSLLAVGACLAASACYGLYGVAVQRNRAEMGPLELATAGQALGAVAMAGPALAVWPAVALDGHLAAAVAFGVLCSGVPFLLYTWLLSRVGPTRALTVTFLIPVFGALWGSLLLHEALTQGHWIGGATILLGTYLVTRKGGAPEASGGPTSAGLRGSRAA